MHQFQFHHSIKFKLLMLVVIAGVFPMVSATALFRSHANNDLIDRIADELIEDANSRNNILSQHLEGLISHAQVMTELPIFNEFISFSNAGETVPDHVLVRAGQELATYQQTLWGSSEHILLLDRSGKVVLSVPNTGWGAGEDDANSMRSSSLPHQGESMRPMIERFSDSSPDRSFVSSLSVDHSNYFQNIIHKMHDELGEISGYIVLQADIERITEVINEDFEIGETRRLYLTTFDGHLVVDQAADYSDHVVTGTGLFNAVELYHESLSAIESEGASSLKQRITEHEEETGFDTEGLVVAGWYTSEQGHEVFGTYIASPVVPWVMCVEMDRSEIEAPMRAQDRLFLVLWVFSIAFLSLMVAVMGRAFWSPLQRMVFAAERVAQGDLSHAIRVTRKDEIGQIERAVDSMRSTLKRQIDDLDALVSDRTFALERANRRLVQDARHDRLTNLANRQELRACLNEKIDQYREDPANKIAVLFFDFDRFKVVNDSLGHATGDALLCSIADRFREGLKDTDLCARFGGDEFVVMLSPIQSHDEALQAADGLLKMFEEPHIIEGHRIMSTASIGLVLSHDRYTNADAMIRDADAAMYQAKLAGKDQVIEFDEIMLENAHRRLRLEEDLDQAIEKNQLFVAYQPIIDLHDMSVKGFEALMRWHHPILGMIGPDEFIPIAEDTGQIVEIGHWIMNQAVEQLVSWDEQQGYDSSLSVNVNVAKRQLIHPDFIDSVKQVLDTHGLEPHRLIIEITESTAIDPRHDMSIVIKKLRMIGVKIAMDDFGTGHSSLSLLHKFDIDIVKIDQSFVQGMEQSRDLSAVLHSIISLAQNTGMCIVAEGAESEDQVATLISHGCDMVQGYFFSKPLSALDAYEYLCNPFERRNLAA